MSDEKDGAERLREELFQLQLAIQEAARQIREEKETIKRQKAAVYDRPVAYLTAHNEKIKYTATLVNTVAAGCIVAGFIGPIAAYLSGNLTSLSSIAVSSVWLPIGIALHLIVRALLDRMRE